MTPRYILARLALSVMGVSLVSGCGMLQRSELVQSAAAPPKRAPAKQEPARAAAPAPARQVGDKFVHRFSGSFAEQPLTLTEEVLARESNAWVVDFTLEQDERSERIRVRFDADTGLASSAWRVEGETERAARLADYEELLSRTVFAADVNDGLVAKTDQTCLVGSDELDCETKTYKVWVGDEPATLQVVHSETFADRDVSGELTTEDGKLVYRAELVEARRGRATTGVASR